MMGMEAYIAGIGPMWKEAVQYFIFVVIIISCTMQPSASACKEFNQNRNSPDIDESRLHKNTSTPI
jgi:hypothetical protein